jgi:DNA polymerase sigma
MAFCFHPNHSASTTAATTAAAATSHEYDLLLDMVRLQSPPPTPVHPRAVGYKSTSQKGARLDYYYREEERLRWTQPRLFQLEGIREDEDAFDNDFYSGKATSIQNRLARMQRQKQKTQQQEQRRYQVIARKKIGPWGEHYSLGCTWEQQDADAKIILGTRLGRQKLPPRSNGGVDPSKQERTGLFVDPIGLSKEVSSTHTILRMLQVASRGHFLRGPLTVGKDCFYAPWLKPDERWFSLGMYLASRYEVALFDSYQHHRKYQSLLGSTIRRRNSSDVNTAALEKKVMAAISLALQEIFDKEQQEPAVDYLRDGVMWALLEQGAAKSLGSSSFTVSHRDATKIVYETPLVQIHLPISVHFQATVRKKLDELMAKDAERSVLKENETSVNGVLGNNGVGPNKKRKKRNKKKKWNGKFKASHGVIPLPVIPAGSEEDLDDDEHNEDGPKITQAALEFPHNDTSPQDRNRNIIMILGILEDTLEDAFEKVGLARTPVFQDDRDKKKSPAKTSNLPIQIKWKKKSTLKGKIPNAEENSKEDSPLIKKNDATTTSPMTSLDSTTIPTGVIARPMSFDLEATEQYHNPMPVPWGIPFTVPSHQFPNEHQDRSLSYHPTDAASMFPTSNYVHASDIHDPFAIGRSLMLGIEGSIGSEHNDNWAFLNRYQSRDESILSEFFPTRHEDGEDDEDEMLMTASTAASIASSTYKDSTLIIETEEFEDDEVVSQKSAPSVGMNLIEEADDESVESIDGTNQETKDESIQVSIEDALPLPIKSLGDEKAGSSAESKSSDSVAGPTSRISTPECRSPSPEAPLTPPPTLSPILLSLADLKDLQKGAESNVSVDRDDSMNTRVSRQLPTLPGHGSLPSSPIPPPKNGLTSSWSRDDLRIQGFRDDQRIKQTSRRAPPPQPPRAAETPTYRAVAAKSLAKPIASTKSASVDFRTHVMEASIRRQDASRESCARSETALDGQREDHHQTWVQEETENYSVTRDETTTITSGVSQRAESEELAVVREERNNFRDMCLTLGAEVAKLKAMLAAQQAVAAASMDFQDVYSQPMMYRPGSFDPNGMQPFFNVGRGMRPGPMSDAGYQRGEHESQVSEDEVYEAVSKARESRVDTVRRMSSSHTIAGSDVSIDFNNSNPTLSGNQLTGTMPLYDSVHSNGLQSRLTKDIFQFLSATNLQLKKLDGKRKLAVERFSRLVKTIWPRAQVKLYGSYMSGLCLPTSDLDFVVCLPAVHKKDVALAPGVLEGRNAINETSQKLLARELKGESWVDPRSIKLIERTIVPVIKVSTKDTRARVIQLDISFDSPEHHGLKANQMVAAILDELPLIRPLMLVLKSFLLDRGLLTAYTGGLSSYCLFLMLARYLQEQPAASGDSGSLLMGFLDFYGNCFDARATGISVSRRQYFARSSNYFFNGYQETAPPQLWNSPSHSRQHQQRVVVNLPTVSMRKDFRRHNSFSETGSVDGSKLRQHRFPPIPNSAASTGPSGAHRYDPHNVAPRTEPHVEMTSQFGQVRSFTFDPLFVEDPLSPNNNVGRNAFRINQVQRAFSDAHRALLASLDWDIHSSTDGEGGDYPLLKCLLQGEDMVYDL